MAPSSRPGRTSEDAFTAWAVAARNNRLAWGKWLASDISDRGDAYACYRASLDREERAAELLAESVTADRRRMRWRDAERPGPP